MYGVISSIQHAVKSSTSATLLAQLEFAH